MQEKRQALSADRVLQHQGTGEAFWPVPSPLAALWWWGLRGCTSGSQDLLLMRGAGLCPCQLKLLVRGDTVSEPPLAPRAALGQTLSSLGIRKSVQRPEDVQSRARMAQLPDTPK